MEKLFSHLMKALTGPTLLSIRFTPATLLFTSPS